MRAPKLGKYFYRGLLALMAVMLLAGSGAAAAPAGVAPAGVAPAPGKPNIVYVLTDDLDAYEWTLLPQLQSMLRAQGVSFDNFFATGGNVQLAEINAADRHFRDERGFAGSIRPRKDDQDWLRHSAC